MSLISARPGAAPPWRMALLLASLSMVSPLSIDTFFPSFPAIAADLHLNHWQVQQIVTAYLVPFACFTLVHGPLSDALGRRRLVIFGLIFYTAASVGCVIAPSFAALLAFRVLQGMAAGIGPTVARAVVRDLYDGSNAQRLMSLMTMIFSLAPALAPVLGGWIHVWFGWRAVFGFMVLMGGALVLSTTLSLPETHPASRRSAFHLGTLVRTSWGIARHWDFMLLAMASAFCISTVLVYIGSAPAIILEQWHLSETQFYYLFVPVIGGFAVSSFITGRLAGRIARARQLRLGFAIMAAASASSCLLQALIASPPILMHQVLMFVLAVGAQFTFPILTLEMLDLYPAARGAAASVSSFIALAGISAAMGLLAPAVRGALPAMALIALLGGALAFGCWRLAYHRIHRPSPARRPHGH